MIAKWIVDGGYIRSQRDGQRHFVSAAQVARLHRLDGRRWVRRIGDERPHLFPRSDGEYRDLRNVPVPPTRPDR